MTRFFILYRCCKGKFCSKMSSPVSADINIYIKTSACIQNDSKMLQAAAVCGTTYPFIERSPSGNSLTQIPQNPDDYNTGL